MKIKWFISIYIIYFTLRVYVCVASIWLLLIILLKWPFSLIKYYDYNKLFLYRNSAFCNGKRATVWWCWKFIYYVAISLCQEVKLISLIICKIFHSLDHGLLFPEIMNLLQPFETTGYSLISGFHIRIQFSNRNSGTQTHKEAFIYARRLNHDQRPGKVRLWPLSVPSAGNNDPLLYSLLPFFLFHCIVFFFYYCYSLVQKVCWRKKGKKSNKKKKKLGNEIMTWAGVWVLRMKS